MVDKYPEEGHVMNKLQVLRSIVSAVFIFVGFLFYRTMVAKMARSSPPLVVLFMFTLGFYIADLVAFAIMALLIIFVIDMLKWYVIENGLINTDLSDVKRCGNIKFGGYKVKLYKYKDDNVDAYATADMVVLPKGKTNKAVAAHEVGHVYFDHIVTQSRIKSILAIVLMIPLLWITLASHSVLGIVGLYVLGWVIPVLVSAFVSRQHEYQADSFSVQHNGKRSFIKSIKILGNQPKPHAGTVSSTMIHIVERLVSTHPTVDERIANAKR